MSVKRSVLELAIECRLRLVELKAFVRLGFGSMARRFEEVEDHPACDSGLGVFNAFWAGLSLGRLRPRRACVCFAR